MTKSRRRISKKKQQEIKKQRKIILFCIFLGIIFVISNYYLFNSSILSTSINEATAKYISFNNSRTTDMLKITNLSIQSDSIGKSKLNNNSILFEIDGEANSKYEVVVYALGNKINEKYIKFYLKDSSDINSGILSDTTVSDDGGRVIYTGKLDKNTRLRLNMWLSNKYNGNTKNISYEIKIKPISM